MRHQRNPADDALSALAPKWRKPQRASISRFRGIPQSAWNKLRKQRIVQLAAAGVDRAPDTAVGIGVEVLLSQARFGSLVIGHVVVEHGADDGFLKIGGGGDGKLLVEVHACTSAIERETYLERRRTLVSEKKTIEEQIARLGRDGCAWLEPMREWVKDASLLAKAATNDDLILKRVCLKKIFGSNLFLKNRRIEFTPIKPYASLREARENFSEN